MGLSTFDIFKIGIGPSSSHTIGPMNAARQFALDLEKRALLDMTAQVSVELFGSLALTGKGHCTDRAVLLGLEGAVPAEIDPDQIDQQLQRIRDERKLLLLGRHQVAFDESAGLTFHRDRVLPGHTNGMRFRAATESGDLLLEEDFYSVGGGFVIRGDENADSPASAADVTMPYPFDSGAELLELCRKHGKSIHELVLENEKSQREEQDVHAGIIKLWDVMRSCVRRGLHNEGILPGGLGVKRRAPRLYRELEAGKSGHLLALDWINVFALAVNEENAAGGRVVTAPTNGAAGIIPAVLHYYDQFDDHADEAGIVRFLLTAAAIGMLYKKNASLSGAEMGCQGEVGVACSMAAAGLVAALEGSPEQVEDAAEIGMEHNLGLTCDPVGGLVQIPCIERNAMGAVKAINAAQLALRGDGSHKVTLDQVIATMRQTGLDMQTKYKETSLGGLAVNVIEC